MTYGHVRWLRASSAGERLTPTARAGEFPAATRPPSPSASPARNQGSGAAPCLGQKILGCVRGAAGQRGPGARSEHAVIAFCQASGATPAGGPATGPGGAGTPCSLRQCANEPCSGGAEVGAGWGLLSVEHEASIVAAARAATAYPRRCTSRRTCSAVPTGAVRGRRRHRHAPPRMQDRRPRRCRRAVWRRRPACRSGCGPARRWPTPTRTG